MMEGCMEGQEDGGKDRRYFVGLFQVPPEIQNDNQTVDILHDPPPNRDPITKTFFKAISIYICKNNIILLCKIVSKIDNFNSSKDMSNKMKLKEVILIPAFKFSV